jgi:hypothetical protein
MMLKELGVPPAQRFLFTGTAAVFAAVPGGAATLAVLAGAAAVLDGGAAVLAVLAGTAAPLT